MTQITQARAGKITPAMKKVAEKEQVSPEFIARGVAQGTIVIPANIKHPNLDPVGIGAGLKTKINANIGTSPQFPDIAKELVKLRAALEAGADAVMDLSTGGDINACRAKIIRNCSACIGTVPVYQAIIESREKYGNLLDMSADELFQVIEKHAADGVDFVTVHCGVTLEAIERLRREGRLTDIVSRGGAFLAGWMLHHERENPLYVQYDRLLELAYKYDLTLSLGDGLRPGCLADATDRAQVQELLVLGELVEKAWAQDVQVMVEGPGHVPLDQIQTNVVLQKRLCKGAPFYVLGPLVTDVAPGYDHITSAIGGAIAAWAGADFLCYVTPAEHLGLPTEEDVREGVIAARIAGHAADIVKGIPGAGEWDAAMARARKNLDWETQIKLAVDPVKARALREEKNPAGLEECTMCGEFCAMKVIGQYLGTDFGKCK